MKQLAACALLILSACVLRAQVVLNLNVTGPNTIVITATGLGPVTDDSSHSYFDGIDLEGLFAPSDLSGTDTASVVISTLTTGDASTGPVYDSASLDNVSESNADLNLYSSTGKGVPQTFTFGQPAFSFATSMTITFSGLVFSGVDYGVVVAGYSGDGSNTPSPLDNFAAAAVSGPGTTPIGVYHVTGVATPEPSTWALLIASAMGLLVIARRRAA